MLRFISILSFFLCLHACQSSKGLQSTDQRSIEFGAGGGFTGEMTHYVLNSSREVYQVDSRTDSLTQVREVRKKECRMAFEGITAFLGDSVESPGNRWYFVEYKDDEKSHRLTWGDPAATMPEGLDQYWKDLMELTKPK